MSDKSVLSCRNLGKSYEEGPQTVVVLSNVELELLPGDRPALRLHSTGGPVPEVLAIGLDPQGTPRELARLKPGEGTA